MYPAAARFHFKRRDICLSSPSERHPQTAARANGTRYSHAAVEPTFKANRKSECELRCLWTDLLVRAAAGTEDDGLL